MKKLILILFLMAGCSSQNLPQVTGNIVQKSHVNDPRTAFYNEVVPRNASGVVTDIAGGLGTATFRWDDSYIKGITIGTATNNNGIFEDTGDLVIKDNSIIVSRFDANGLDGGGIKIATVDGDRVVDGTLDYPKLGTHNNIISSSSGVFVTSSSTFSDATNLSVTITTTGRPVLVALVHDGSANVGSLTGLSSTAMILCQIKIKRGSTDIHFSEYRGYVSAAITNWRIPVSSVSQFDAPSAGTYTYKVQLAAFSTTCSVNYAKLVAYEL